MIKAIVFDLDNTLYDQRLFNCGAFEDVSSYVSKRFGVNKNRFYEMLVRAWNADPGSRDIFNEVLSRMGVPGVDIKKLVEVFHRHTPALKLYPGAKAVLSKLKRTYKLGMVTDGRVPTQKKKIAALGLGRMFHEIVYTSENGVEFSKPNKAPYERILGIMEVRPGEAVYVGDNPNVDFAPAKKVGMATVRILKGRFKNVRAKRGFDADYKIKNLSELFNIVDSLNKRG